MEKHGFQHYIIEFAGFDESLDPDATEEEWQEYTNAFEAEEKRQLESEKRFRKEVEVTSW